MNGKDIEQKPNAFVHNKLDAGYPSWIQDYPKMPNSIYGRGDSDLPRGVAIIGSRHATAYGVKAAFDVASWVAEYGLVTYSGCAQGCDQAAHRGALSVGGKTIAVLGCGPDIAYPVTARALLDDIAYSQAVISPFSWGTRPARYTFVVRNRLIAALSYAVIVVEGREGSGTFSAIQHAEELGIDICAVPGSIYSAESSTPNHLIASGATVISSKSDLSTLLERNGITCAAKLKSEPHQNMEGSDKTHSPILQLISQGPIHAEEVARALQLNLDDVLFLLLDFECSGEVRRGADGRYFLN